MSDKDRTINGKFDARCVVCGMAVYRLWVDSEPPPPGCSDGLDSEPWRCSAVYNRLVSIVIAQDHLKKPIGEASERLLQTLGVKGEELLAHIRSGSSPESWEKLHGKRRFPPEYSDVRMQ